MHVPALAAAGLLALALTACRVTSKDLEAADGWVSLTSPSDWRGYGQEAVPEGWMIEDRTVHLARPGGGDLVTTRTYGSFELNLQWRISPRGNSGILFHVVETEDPSYHSGPEMQVLDNAVFDGERNALTAAGANYALHGKDTDDTRPVGEWNDVLLIVRGPHVEHWLNGKLQCEYELWSEDWRQRVAASKFAAWPTYGQAREGHVCLQDHGNEVWYRDVRIRALPDEAPAE